MQRKDISPYELLQMFAMLEHSLHRPFMGEYVVSQNFNPLDIISLHKEARRMLDFVGLTLYHPLVENANLDNAIGDVHLNDDSRDWGLHIRLSNSIKGDYHKVLCVLAHEICHKVLQYYHFPILYGIDNEYYTDITTFYVGFGKLTLNGAKDTYRIGNKIFTNTIGYLSDKTLSIAYLIIRQSYGLDDSKLTNKGMNLAYSSFFSIEKYIVLSKLSQCRTLSETPKTYFEHIYVLKCPYCGKSSYKYYPHLYQKKIVCTNCHQDFIMDVDYVFGKCNIFIYMSQVVHKLLQKISLWVTIVFPKKIVDSFLRK